MSQSLTTPPQDQGSPHASRADAMDPALLLRDEVQNFVRRFGLLSPRTTPCGQPLSVSEAHALQHLLTSSASAEGLSQKALGEALCIDKSNVSRLCAKLVRSGHIEAQRAQSDGRALRLRLTPRGRILARRIDAASRAHFQELLSHLSASSRPRVLKALAELNQALLASLACLVLTLACRTPPSDRGPTRTNAAKAAPAHTDGTHANGNGLRIHGSLHGLMQGDRGAKVTLDQFTNPGWLAVGALSELRGEVSLLDGELWLSYADPASNPASISRATEESAALLVAAHVSQWMDFALPVAANLEQLPSHVARAAAQLGFPNNAPFAVRIEGPFDGLRWHVIDGARLRPGAHHSEHVQASRTGSYAPTDSQALRVIGLHSTEHAGIFTHHDSPLHLHVIDRKAPHTGHVDALRVPQGTLISLAKPTAS